jgi:chorismate mutase
MLIRRLEGELAKVTGRIQACEAELTSLKEKRHEIRERLAEAKKAAKRGEPLPDEGGSLALVGQIGTVLTENVVQPIAELLSISQYAEKPEASSS